MNDFENAFTTFISFTNPAKSLETLICFVNAREQNCSRTAQFVHERSRGSLRPRALTAAAGPQLLPLLVGPVEHAARAGAAEIALAAVDHDRVAGDVAGL